MFLCLILFDKTIFIHTSEIEASQSFLKDNLNSDTWNPLDRVFMLNTYILADLVHEFEHVGQFDKIFNPDDSVESKLLGLTHFSYKEMLNESEFRQFLINNFSIWLSDNLANIHLKLGKFNREFGTDVLYERLADIHSAEKIESLLSKVDFDIPGTTSFFSAILIQHLLRGYDSNQSIPFPMVRYIKEVRNFEIPEVNEYIDKVVIPCICEVVNIYERLKFGLYAKDEELEELRKILV